MQKVEGSSPFIRFSKALEIRGFGLLRGKRLSGAATKWLHLLPLSFARSSESAAASMTEALSVLAISSRANHRALRESLDHFAVHE
jgi:hypothetical protein